MAKKIIGYVKLQLPAGKATPAPAGWTSTRTARVNIMGFCKDSMKEQK